MRLNFNALSGVSLAAIVLGATSAHAAQTAQPTTSVTSSANAPSTDAVAAAQTNPADPSPGPAPTAVDDSPTIVVTGLRKSLQSARNIKKNSTQQIDAIVAEDIGKLPDLAVSETAARIPGLQVTRRGGEADTVLIRGLPDFATTYNGREIFTAETRVVALQDFPSANIASLEVFKTTSADLVEAGLAGLVNVRSRRPFDFKGLEVAGSAWALHTRQAGKLTPNGNFLVSDRFKIGSGGAELGLLLNASFTDLKYLDSEPSNTDFIAPGPNGNRLPDIQRLFYRSGDRKRPSVNAAMQLRVSPNLIFYAEGLYQGFRNQISDRLFEQPLYGGSSYTNLVVRPGTTLISSGTVVNPALAVGFQGGTYNKTDTYQFAGGGSLDLGRLKITADVARTKSTFTGSTESVDYALRDGLQYSVNFNNEVPQFTPTFDATNPANYVFRGLYEEAQQSRGKDIQARIDATYDTPISFLPKLMVGVRYADRDAHREFGNRYRENRFLQIPIIQVPLDYRLFRPGFRGTDVQSGFRTFLSPTYDSIRRNAVALRQLVTSRPFGFSFGTFTTAPPPPNPDSVYDANEKTSAAYAQAHYQFGDVIDGDIGLRVEETRNRINGTSRVNNIFTPVAISNKYTDYLPNVSARIHFTPQMQLRLSATKTRTRPTFGDLNPSSNIGPLSGSCTPGANPVSTTSNQFDCARRGGGGNPFLRPFKSYNYDASLEYYFSPTGMIAADVFKRDLSGFIQNRETRYIDPALGPLILNAPVNTGKGRIEGAEAQVSTFFDFPAVPRLLRNFGVQANVTYLKAKVQDGVSGTLAYRPIFGVSKWTYNLVAMYEGGGVSARVSYNKRGRTLETIQYRDNNDPTRFGGDLYREYSKPAGRLDLSASYTVTPNATVFFDWTNILNKPFKQYLSSARNGAARSEYIRFLRYEENTMSLGVRVRL